MFNTWFLEKDFLLKEVEIKTFIVEIIEKVSVGVAIAPQIFKRPQVDIFYCLVEKSISAKFQLLRGFFKELTYIEHRQILVFRYIQVLVTDLYTYKEKEK